MLTKKFLLISASFAKLDQVSIATLHKIATKYFNPQSVRAIGHTMLIRVEGGKLNSVLHSINMIERALSGKSGKNLDIGWAISQDEVHEIDSEWTSEAVDKCMSLSRQARSGGVLIDRQAFPVLPRSKVAVFSAQIRYLSANIEQPVWVSRGLSERFVPREIVRQTPEVHIAGTCFKSEDNEISLLFTRRSASRELFPGKLEGCGGQLRQGETFQQGIVRHYKDELNIDIEPLDIHNFYTIERPEGAIPGIRFLCKVVRFNSPSLINHSEIFWLKEKDFRALPADEFAGDLKNDVMGLLDQYRVGLLSKDIISTLNNINKKLKQ